MGALGSALPWRYALNRGLTFRSEYHQIKVKLEITNPLLIIMEYNWSELRTSLEAYSLRILNRFGLNISEMQIREAVTIFGNMVNFKLPYILLNGLGPELLSSLSNSCITNIGNVTNLRSVLNAVDSFLKRVLILSGKKTFHEVDRMAMPQMFIETGVLSSFQNARGLDSIDLTPLLQEKAPFYIFLRFRQDRNTVHNTPDWLPSDVTDSLQYAIAFYIWVIHGLKNELLSNHSEFGTEEIAEMDEESLKTQRLLYDYVKFGRSTNEIKNRIVTIFICHSLYEKGEMSVSSLETLIQTSLSVSFGDKSFRRILDRMRMAKSIRFSNKDLVTLTDEEQEHQDKAKKDFQLNHQHFLESVEEVLHPYSLGGISESVVNHLIKLFADNSSSAADEFIGKISANEDDQCLLLFKQKLQEEGIPAECVTPVGVKLLELCKTDGFALSIGVGKAFSSLVSMELNDGYAERDVYLDSQIVLSLLCLNSDYAIPDEARFRNAQAFSELIYKSHKLKFKFSRHYLPEISGHIKNALGLAELVDLPAFKGSMVSNNVFYQHYYVLRESDGLPNGVDNFADYIENHFNLRLEDYDDSRLYTIINAVLQSQFQDLGIDLIECRTYSPEDIELHKDLLRSDLLQDRPKQEARINKDAVMCCILAEAKNNSVVAPFFVTQDSCFRPYRKRYMEEIDRSSSSCWFLFSPSKLVNHMDLLNLKIQGEAFTDDLLVMLKDGSDDVQSNKLLDVINRISGLKGINKRTRKQIQRSLLEIDDDGAWVDEPDTIPAFARKFQLVYDHYKEEGHRDRLMVVFDNDDLINIFLRIIKEGNENEMNTIYNSVDKQIEIFLYSKEKN